MKRGIATLAVGALALTACNGNDGRVPVAEYATHVCTALGTWEAGVRARSEALRSQMSNRATPEQGKVALVRFTDQVLTDTSTMISRVKSAGVPDVDSGAKVADELATGLEPARTAIASAHSEAEKLPTTSRAEFAKAARSIGTEVQSSLTRIAQELDQIDSSSVDQAFHDSAACQRINNQ